jgi:hypothetical protein
MLVDADNASQSYAFSDKYLGNGVLTGSIPFTFGVPIAFRMYLEAITMVDAGTASGHFAFSNFYGTATLGAFTVQDSQGQAVGGASVVSDAGYNYAVASTTPEPATITLVALGLVGIISRRRRL